MKIFVEEQRFTQLWLHLLLVISFTLPLVLLSKEWIASKGEDNDTAIGFLAIIGALFITYGLIFSLKLKTRIDEKGISYRFKPFHFSDRFIDWNEIEKAHIRKYNALSEYGGWGIKGKILWRWGRGTSFSTRGNIGLQLELISGKKILIGTQKEEEVKRVLHTYFDKKNSSEVFITE